MMSAFALTDIAVATDGKIVGEAQCNNVCTDTRLLKKGELFVALCGEKYDGNNFVEQAVKNGAAAVVVNNKNAHNSTLKEVLPEILKKLPHVIVEDTRKALGQIAKMNRQNFSGQVIALTGSAGKTTCKDMIASILAECGSVLSTKGNFNNEIGVPLTLLKISRQHKYAVIEMGASRENDIHYLAEFTQANIGLVTNAMPTHLTSFGNIATIAATKGELFENLPTNGIAVINHDDEFFNMWCRLAENRKIVSFSKNNSQADVYAKNIQVKGNGKTQFTLCSDVKSTDITASSTSTNPGQGEVDISLTLLGEHNIGNALAAAATAIAAGASLKQIKNGLSTVTATKGRLKLIETNPVIVEGFKHRELTVIDDSYNASPGSAKVAIDVLAKFSQRRCLILGTMAELGGDAEKLHVEVASYASDKGIDQLIAVGEFSHQMAEGFGAETICFDTIDQLLSVIENQIRATVVLIKGSRCMRMEKVVEALIRLPSIQPQSTTTQLLTKSLKNNREET